MLKTLATPDQADSEHLCFPTHQVFNLSEQPSSSLPPAQERLSISINPSVITAPKRSASPELSNAAKKARNERMHSKDFIPPDVSGLSKREARLVKNRAAAFLSRQRKREEFETMEVRVAELEQENARLLALTQNNDISNSLDMHSEVESLRAQLAAAEERERQLSERLLAQAAEAAAAAAVVAPSIPPPVKVEEFVDSPMTFPPSPRSSTPLKAGASLGLMVLLCALPTLLSMPAVQPTVPTSFTLPNPPLSAPSSTFDFNTFLSPDYDWSLPNMNSMMELDDLPTVTPSAIPAQKLEFSASDVSELDPELAGLDISFDATPSDSGKIRVRIHPSSSASSRATSPGPSSPPETDTWDSERTTDSLVSSSALSALSSSLAQLSYPPPPSPPSGDPFLGVGAIDFSTEDIFGFEEHGSELSYPATASDLAKKRVRIALKSLPTAGGEGGEWEVQVC